MELWFPDLAPLIAQYLASRDADTEVVGRYVSGRLRDLNRGDWVDSWAAYTAGLLPKGLVSTRRLQKVLRAAEAGPLTKAEAARALLRHDQLSERVWRRICAELPPPIRAEVIFSAIVEPGKPEWLRRFAGSDLPAGLDAVRSRLPEGI